MGAVEIIWGLRDLPYVRLTPFESQHHIGSEEWINKICPSVQENEMDLAMKRNKVLIDFFSQTDEPWKCCSKLNVSHQKKLNMA